MHATSPEFTLDQFLSKMSENYGVEITMVVQVKSNHNSLLIKIPIVDLSVYLGFTDDICTIHAWTPAAEAKAND